MKVLIVEDEIDARKVLVYLLKQFFSHFNIVGQTGSVVEARKLIKQHHPDLVFLDVQLEDGTGFDLLKNCSHLRFYTIFTTAYSGFAIDAIKYSASDYLLKPIAPEELKKAIKKVVKLREREIEIRHLENIYSKNIEKSEKISIKTSEGTFLIPLHDIIRMEADGAYTNIICVNQNIIVSKNLKYYEDILPLNKFVRSHQSHLINKEHIVKMTIKGNLLMSNNEQVPVSFRKKSIIRKMLKN